MTTVEFALKSNRTSCIMTDKFINNIRSIRKAEITPEVWHQARRALIDYLSVTISGAKAFREKEIAYMNAQGEIGDATVIGHSRKCTMQTAALMNGMSAHVIELDDGHRRGALHVGATVFSALLPVAEHEHLSSEDLLYGAIIGYEATIRLACAVQPGNKLRGYHATGTCGTVGATIGIAAALGLDFDQMKSSISAAVTSSAGVLEMQEDNADLKPLNVGRAAMDAVAAAYLGKARFKAPSDAIGGKRGFLKVMTDDPHTEFITDFDKDVPLAITQIYMKTYAACRHTHPAIEAALTLRPKLVDSLTCGLVDSIEVEAYKLAVAGHDHTDILGVSSAKMSMPFAVALALCKGSAGMEDFNEANVTEAEILALTRKVKVVENEELSALVPKKRASILNVIMKDGTILSHRVDYPKGEPENPLTEEELIRKFNSLAMASGVSEENCSKVTELISQPTFNINIIVDLLAI